MSESPLRHGAHPLEELGIALGDVPSELVQGLFARAHSLSLGPLKVIAGQGESVDAFFVLLRGAVKLVRRDPAGTDSIILGFARGPSLLADAGLFDHGPRSASLITLRTTSFLYVSASDVDLLSREFPSLTQVLALSIAKSARNFVESAEDKSLGTVTDRLLRVLDRLAFQHGTSLGQGRFIPIPLRRHDLAGMVNAKTETVSRFFARLEREGRVRTTREGIWWKKNKDGPPATPARGTPNPKDGGNTP